MPTPEFFDFDATKLATFSQEQFERDLRTHPTIFVNHLQIATRLDDWAANLPEEQDVDYANALREVAAHLRQGDYLPGGTLLS